MPNLEKPQESQELNLKEREWKETVEELYQRSERMVQIFNEFDDGRMDSATLRSIVQKEMIAQRDLVLKYAEIPAEWYEKFWHRHE